MIVKITGLFGANYDELIAMTDDLLIDNEIYRESCTDDEILGIHDIYIEPVNKDCFEVNITYDCEDLYLNIRTKSYDVTWSCPKSHYVTLLLT